MDYPTFEGNGMPASVRLSRFRGASGVEEHHLVIQPAARGGVEAQLKALEAAYRSALAQQGLGGQTAVLRRFFCSDLANQREALASRPFSNPLAPDEPCAISWVCQPPGLGAKVSLWAYHVRDPGGALERVNEDSALTLRRGRLAHHWKAGMTCPSAKAAYGQTQGVLEEYESFLRRHGMNLAENALRTWFFVQNIDADYQGLVKARREFFATRGLTADTHFIASTGVGGAHADVASQVALDAYAVSGLTPGQVRFLAAPDHLSPTHIYGVTFERGTAVSYRDRRQVILSGTASIDREGRIMHPGDVLRQLDRTLENMQALLAQAGAGLADMGVFIVYLRDLGGDHDVVQREMQARFGKAPMIIVAGAVCRPGWLIEIEGLAVVPADNPALPAF
jgi:enamine deaminase RidA (YjgF/YER057c/UK114 family)